MATTKCLNPDHNNRKVYARGLCSPCYHSAQALVSKGITTWDKLVKAGKALAKRTGTGKTQQWLLSK